MPQEYEGDARIRRHLVSLAAVVVREKGETAIVEILQEHNTR
jgi:hypothetical protein